MSADSLKRVTLRLDISGQTAEFSRTVASPDNWTSVADEEVMEMARELVEFALTGLGYVEAVQS